MRQPDDLEFSETEIIRYSRNILLPELGAAGQARLRAGSVILVGAGGIGSPALLYLAAAGVGRIGIVDDDRVELSNLQRQIAHTTGRIGELKVASAIQSAAALNPEISLEPHALRLHAGNAARVIASYDIVLDGSDNFATRYLVADACGLAGKPLVAAWVLRFEAYLAVFPPGGPCWRCLYPRPPAASDAVSCAQAGVLGSMTGMAGSLAATEVVKLLAGIGRPLTSRVFMWEALAAEFQMLGLARNADCPLCGDAPRIHGLAGHPTQ